MLKTLRTLLAGTVALAGLTPVAVTGLAGGSAIIAATAIPLDAAFAKGSDDDKGGSSGSSSSSSDDDDDSDDDSNDDSADDDGDDDRGRGRGSDDAPGDDRGGLRGVDDNRQESRSSRPEVRVTFAAGKLESILAGTHVAVDDLGRLLEVEIEVEHGRQVVKVKPHGGDARRNPGPITSVSVVPVAEAPIHR